jgi:hypothetical protein
MVVTTNTMKSLTYGVNFSVYSSTVHVLMEAMFNVRPLQRGFTPLLMVYNNCTNMRPDVVFRNKSHITTTPPTVPRKVPYASTECREHKYHQNRQDLPSPTQRDELVIHLGNPRISRDVGLLVLQSR